MANVVVVPTYQSTVSDEGRYALLQLRKLNIKNVTLVCPKQLDVDAYRLLLPDILVERFDAAHFQSLLTYNRLVSSVDFYQRFAERFDWLLMHQLDAFLLDDRIDHFTELGYSYFGAPWKDGVESPFFFLNRRIVKKWGARFYVGNGGFSLRNISKTIHLLARKRNHITHQLFLEDIFFGYWGTHDHDFKACPPNIAATFALETHPRYWHAKSNALPMGIHAAMKWDPDFYSPLLKSHYDEIDLAYPLLIQHALRST
jgi:hypothetical protein